MTRTKAIFFYYNIFFIVGLLGIGVYTEQVFNSPILLIVVFPLVIYFWLYLVLYVIKSKVFQNSFFWALISLLLVFNILSTSILFVTSLWYATSTIETMISFLYLPLPIYFFLTIFDWYKKTEQNNLLKQKIKKSTITKNRDVNEIDVNRRKFLKMLGTTGVSMFILSLLNPKQAGAAFFGSVPGQGTVKITETIPTDVTKVNGSILVSYNAAGEAVKVEKIINGTTYTKTIIRSDMVITATLPVSVWD